MSDPQTDSVTDAELASLGLTRAEYEASLSGAATSGGSTKPKVYWGTEDVTPARPFVYPKRKAGFIGPIPGAPLVGPVEKVPQDKPLKDLDMAKLDILTWGESDQDDLAQKLIAAGMLSEHYSFLDLRKAWNDLCDFAADHTKAGQKLTPFDMIDLYGGEKNSQAHDVVTRAISISNPDQARGLLDDALSSQLGRRATQSELDDFQSQLNTAQRANPLVTTTSYDAMGQQTQSVQSGGLDEQNYTDKLARSGEHSAEYAHYQAATTYANALFNAIKSPV